MSDPLTGGRFLSVDPIGREFPYLSPYQYAGNNPIRYVDLDGLEQGERLENGIILLPSDYTRRDGLPLSLRRPIITIEQQNKLKQLKSSELLEQKQTYLSDGGVTSLPQYKFQKKMIETYGDFVLPLEVTGRLLRGEDVSIAEMGIEAIGLIPAGKLLGRAPALYRGLGADILESFVKKVDNQATHLTDMDLSGAIKDIFGTPVVIAGKTYDHLKEVTDALHGLGKQLNTLNRSIGRGELSGEVLEQAERLRTNLQKQKDKIQNVLKKAEKKAAGS
jgi:hypothetical protein